MLACWSISIAAKIFRFILSTAEQALGSDNFFLTYCWGDLFYLQVGLKMQLSMVKIMVLQHKLLGRQIKVPICTGSKFGC